MRSVELSGGKCGACDTGNAQATVAAASESMAAIKIGLIISEVPLLGAPPFQQFGYFQRGEVAA